jgi:Protein of unknown function (DUF1579)
MLLATLALVLSQAPAPPPDAKAPPPAPPPAAATPPADNKPPPPAAELAAAMKPLEGKWKCAGKMVDSPFDKAHALSAVMTWKKDLGGYWYTARYEEKKTKDNPAPYVMNAFAGWDPQKSVLVRSDVDNRGVITHLTSKGFEGDKLVWSGAVAGTKMTFTDTITKKSAKEIASSMQMIGEDGKAIPLGDLTCKK